MLHGAQPLGDDEGRAALHQLGQRLLDQVLGLHVHAAWSSRRGSGCCGSSSSVRAMAMRCFWPPESVTPRSPTQVS